MGLTNKTETLGKHVPMIGLSADWIFQTWLIGGTIEDGMVIFENEDNSCYEIIEFQCKDEDRVERILFSGEFHEIETYVINTLSIPFK